jgi:hypothetical protein
MSIYKRVSGNLVVETVGSTDSITFRGAAANTATVVIDGNLTVTGDVSLTGNISGDKLINGTTYIEIATPNGDANITVNGVHDVFVATVNGIAVSGSASATGNVIGGNLVTSGAVAATGNVGGSNVNASGNIILTRTGNGTTNPVIRLDDSNTAATTVGGNIGAVEWRTSTASGAGARVTAAVKAVYSDSLGNANILIQSANSSGSMVNRVVVQGITGNVGIANSSPLHSLSVGGNIYGSGTLGIVGNITGGNLTTAGKVAATGNISGANISATGNLSATGTIVAIGDISGANISASGTANVVGNITGSNLELSGRISAAGNLITTDISSTTLAASGNIAGGNLLTLGTSNVGVSIVTGTQTVVGNITGGNVQTGIVQATGNINSLNVNTGTMSATGNVIAAPGAFFVGDGGFLSNVQVAANVSVSQISLGTTNWTIRGSGGNLTADIGGSANTVTFYGGGVDITGVFSAVGNVIGSNLIANGAVIATGNITGGNVSAATGTFTTVTGAASATNLTTGTVPSSRLSGQYTIDVVGSATTVTAAAQSNITSVGTLTALTVTGNVAGGNLTTAGTVAAASVAVRNGTAFAELSPQTLQLGDQIGSTPFIDFNSGTALVDYDSRIIASGGTGTAGQGNLSIIANKLTVSGAELAATGAITATGNITGGNIITSGKVTATGNITGNYIFGNGSLLTGIDAASIQNGTSNVRVISAGGNVVVSIAAAPVLTVAANGQYTTGIITATGAVTGSSFVGSGSGLTGIPNGALTNSAVTINSTSVSLGGSATITAHTPSVLTVNNSGTGSVSGITFNGSTPVTISHNTIGAAPQAGNTSIVTVGTVTTGTWNASSISTAYTDAKVTSVASRTGAVTLAQADISGLTTASTPTFAGLTVGTGSVTAGNIVNSNLTGVGNIGSSTVYYDTVFAKATSAQYADLAEKFLADAEYPVGTVLVFGGDQEVTIANNDTDRRLAGVVSANPSYLMNSGLTGQFPVAIALQGRVPCGVIGPVRKGDMLVSAPGGFARAHNDPPSGSIIGKSLENFEGASGTIEIVVGRD